MCATCHVYVDESWIDRLRSIGDNEDALLDGVAAERLPTSRLSCQIEIRQNCDGLVLRLPDRQTLKPALTAGRQTVNVTTTYQLGDIMRDFRFYVALARAAGCAAPHSAEISGDVVRVGVLNDISGIFQDTNGMGSVEAARMAAEDFAGGGKNIKVEIVYADHQNKADVGNAHRARWLEIEGVDAIVDVPNSSVGLSINTLLRDTKMTFLASSTASSDLTGKACSPNTIQWVNDTWATGNTTAAAMIGRGGKDWYFITVDYALGKGIEAEATKYIETHGGKVLGSSKHPLGTSDFASFLLQAQSSKAERDRTRQCRRRHHQHREAGRGVRHPAERPEAGRVPAVHQRRPRHGPEGRAGPAADGSVLLGHERRHPRLRQALRARGPA